VLVEHTSRALLYVALTRGRDTNTAYLYERIAGEGEYEQSQPDGMHIMRRGTSRDAAHLVRAIIANHNDQARTAHHIAAQTPDRDQLPDRVQSLLDRRANAVQHRRTLHQTWWQQTHEWAAERQRSIDQHLSRTQDQGLDYGIE
jgi:ATP-dependent exoDNAse (exonuclease V) beta subunit